jgi:hypothetical protein
MEKAFVLTCRIPESGLLNSSRTTVPAPNLIRGLPGLLNVKFRQESQLAVAWSIGMKYCKVINYRCYRLILAEVTHERGKSR